MYRRGSENSVEPNLCDAGVGTLESGLDALRWFVGELDGRLQQRDRELRVHLGRDPQPELLVHRLGRQNLQQQTQHDQLRGDYTSGIVLVYVAR